MKHARILFDSREGQYYLEERSFMLWYAVKRKSRHTYNNEYSVRYFDTYEEAFMYAKKCVTYAVMRTGKTDV